MAPYSNYLVSQTPSLTSCLAEMKAWLTNWPSLQVNCLDIILDGAFVIRFVYKTLIPVIPLFYRPLLLFLSIALSPPARITATLFFLSSS